MRFTWVVAAATTATAIVGVRVAAGGAPGHEWQCPEAKTDPSYDRARLQPSAQVDTEILNLDLAPEDRWTAVLSSRVADIQPVMHTIQAVVSHGAEAIFGVPESKLNERAEEWVDRLPAEYAQELRGVAKAVSMPLSVVFTANILYEINADCTSLVAQDPASGEIWHARNLDFALPGAPHLTALLRKSMIDVNIVKEGKVVARMTTFGGFIGVLTGMRPGAFAVTVDSRQNHEDVKWQALRAWLNKTGPQDAQFTSLLNRDNLMQCADFNCALQRTQDAQLLSPAYVILSGTQPGEGAVVTRNASATTQDTWLLKTEEANSKRDWILETNYDHWDSPPDTDDRRHPANACMEELVKETPVSAKSLFAVLSSIPSRNTLTVYTSLFNSRHDIYQVFKQECVEAACSPAQLAPMGSMAAPAVLMV